MVDATRLRSILDAVRADVDRLELLRDAQEQASLDACKYRLVTAIEGLVSAGRHVIAAGGLRGPETYADTFTVLADAGLDADLATRGREMARFRNLLVHGYADVDDDRVRKILATRLDELRDLASALATLATSGSSASD
jgi:uncharacterized protein YutE (UPF0331/DUF86 family)